MANPSDTEERCALDLLFRALARRYGFDAGVYPEEYRVRRTRQFRIAGNNISVAELTALCLDDPAFFASFAQYLQEGDPSRLD